MIYCNHCGVSVEHVTCPLCHRKLGDSADITTLPQYPEYSILTKIKARSFTSRMVTFLSIVIISACFLINMLVSTDYLWVLAVAGAVVYLFLSFNHTLFSLAHTGSKILVQVFGLSIMLLSIDIMSRFHRWSVNFVIPFLIITATLLITVIILNKRMRWHEYVGYILAMIVMGFLPIVLYVSGIATILWACAITSLYALLTLTGMLIFSDKTFKEEFVRRFHF